MSRNRFVIVSDNALRFFVFLYFCSFVGEVPIKIKTEPGLPSTMNSSYSHSESMRGNESTTPIGNHMCFLSPVSAKLIVTPDFDIGAKVA